MLAPASLGGCTIIFSTEGATKGDSGVGGDAFESAFDANGDAWPEPQFKWRLPFTLKSPVAEDLEGFPVLLSIDSEMLAFSETPFPDTSRIKLVHNGVRIAVELDAAGTAGKINLWFKADLNEGETKTYYLYFDESAEGDFGSPSVWSSYESRWGFNSDDGVGKYWDSSENMRHATKSDSLGSQATGKIGNGVSASSTNPGSVVTDAIASAQNPLSGSHTCISISAWVKPAIANAVRRSLVETMPTQSGEVGTYHLSYSTVPSALISYEDSNISDNEFSTQIPVPEIESPLSLAAWSWIAVNIRAYDSQVPSAFFFVNEDVIDQPLVPNTGQTYLTRPTVHIGNRLNGTMDELRMSTTCRTKQWLLAEYKSVQSPLPVFSPLESKPE